MPVFNPSGTIDLASPGPIGSTTPAAGTFTSLTDSGPLILTGTGGASFIDGVLQSPAPSTPAASHARLFFNSYGDICSLTEGGSGLTLHANGTSNASFPGGTIVVARTDAAQTFAQGQIFNGGSGTLTFDASGIYPRIISTSRIYLRAWNGVEYIALQGIVDCNSIVSESTLAVYGASTLTGNLTSNGAFISVPQALSGSGVLGAVNLTTLTTTISTSGAATSTLAAGTSGQTKKISMIAYGGDAVVTVADASWGGAGTATFNDIYDTLTLEYLNSKWVPSANSGVTNSGVTLA